MAELDLIRCRSYQRRQVMTYLISEVNRERQKLLAKVLTPVLDRLLNVLQLPQDLRCLDLGCGIGETTRQLARKLDSPRKGHRRRTKRRLGRSGARIFIGGGEQGCLRARGRRTLAVYR